MQTRRFFYASLALAIAAISLQLTALSQFGRSVSQRGRADSAEESERTALIAEASKCSSRAEVIRYVGFVFALGTIAFVVVSARCRERAWRLLTVGLLFFYLVLLLVMV